MKPAGSRMAATSTPVCASHLGQVVSSDGPGAVTVHGLVSLELAGLLPGDAGAPERGLTAALRTAGAGVRNG
jgi:hypothetical protein